VHDTKGMRRPTLVLARAVIVMCGLATGVSACVYPDSGQQPPVVMCGETVYGGGMEAFFYEVDQGGTITSPSFGNTVIISVGGCDKGSHVTWTPRSAARMVQSVYAKDGLLAVVGLQPTSQDAVFTVTATRDGKLVGRITYDPAS
jgi:hypothetical protein